MYIYEYDIFQYHSIDIEYNQFAKSRRIVLTYLRVFQKFHFGKCSLYYSVSLMMQLTLS